MNAPNLLTLLTGTYKQVSRGRKGPEHHGPCPLCGGTDRCMVWPEHGTWRCRQCQQGGDAIELLRQRDGLGYRDACAALGIEPKETGAALPRIKPHRAASAALPASREERAFAPRPEIGAAVLWLQQATALIAQAAERLQQTPEQLDWLSQRGISAATAERLRLGWIDRDSRAERAVWGVPVETDNSGKLQTTLWLPRGLVIPRIVDGLVTRLRIRRTDGDRARFLPERKYHVVKGSSLAPLYLHPERPLVIVVESELDAVLLSGVFSGAVACYAAGSATVGPDLASHHLLQSAAAIIVALDDDAAGRQGALLWRRTYPQAVHYPVPAKDPGEYVSAGGDLVAWLGKRVPARLYTAQDDQKISLSGHSSGCGAAATASGAEETKPLKTGRTISGTPWALYRDEEHRQADLATDPNVVAQWTLAEIGLVNAVGMNKDEAALIAECKRIFGGEVCDVIDLRGEA